jgi:hypothetical protein
MIRKEVYSRGNFAAKRFLELCKSIQPTQDYITGKKAKKIRQALRIYDFTQKEFNKVFNREEK